MRVPVTLRASFGASVMPVMADADTPVVPPAEREPAAAEGSRDVPALRTPLASFRLPAFAPDEADLWLLQVDCAYDVAGISDSATKFKLLVANLPTSVASQVRDVIVSQPGDFDALCGALRQRLAQSRASRLEALLQHQQLGDRKPSQLLRDMRGQLTSAGDASVDSGLLRTLFLQRLPQSARAALSLLAECTPLGDLADAADRFLEASRSAGGVATVSAGGPAPPPVIGAGSSDPPGLAAAIIGLTAVVNRLDMSNRRLEDAVYGRRSRPGSPARRPRSASSSRAPGPVLCWYHQRYGARARKCVSPCEWRPDVAGNLEA